MYNSYGSSSLDVEGLFPIIFLLVIFNFIVFGYLCSDLSKNKGYDSTKYFWIGAFFGVVGLIYVIGLSNLKIEKRLDKIHYTLDRLSENLKKDNSNNSKKNENITNEIQEALKF